MLSLKDVTNLAATSSPISFMWDDAESGGRFQGQKATDLKRELRAMCLLWASIH